MCLPRRGLTSSASLKAAPLGSRWLRKPSGGRASERERATRKSTFLCHWICDRRAVALLHQPFALARLRHRRQLTVPLESRLPMSRFRALIRRNITRNDKRTAISFPSSSSSSPPDSRKPPSFRREKRQRRSCERLSTDKNPARKAFRAS